MLKEKKLFLKFYDIRKPIIVFLNTFIDYVNGEGRYYILHVPISLKITFFVKELTNLQLSRYL